MANERGTKRTDPDSGKKFYDLNLDPIVSPYTGKSYPRSFFEQISGKASPVAARKVDDEDETEEEEVEDVAAPEIVSLEEADAEEAGDDEVPDDVEDVEVDEELGDDEEDVFLEEDEDEDDGLGFEVGDDEDR